MSGRTRYGLQVPTSMIPCVEVTEPVDPVFGHWFGDQPVVVKRCYGFTLGHAMARAQTWSRKHGDKR